MICVIAKLPPDSVDRLNFLRACFPEDDPDFVQACTEGLHMDSWCAIL